MKEKEINYVAPEVEVLECAIEGVFCTSGPGVPGGNGTEGVSMMNQSW